MAKTYTYDPTKIFDKSLNQMRFELGDTSVEGGEETCAICDEEYRAILTNSTKGFGFAKYKCLQAITMKLSFEVDFSTDGMSFSLHQRYPRWKEMLKQEQKKFQCVSANASALGDNSMDGGHYFRLGMNDNDRVSFPSYPFQQV